MWGDAPPPPDRARRVPAVRRDRGCTFGGLLGVITALNLLGLVMVLSASSVCALDTYGSVLVHRAAPGMWLASASPSASSSCASTTTAGAAGPCRGSRVSGLLIGLVLVPGVGMNVNGATRWLGYGPLTLQPSEIAKLAVLLFVARPPGPAGRPHGRPAPHARSRRRRVRRVRAAPHAAAQPRHHARARQHRAVAVLYVAGTPMLPLAGVGLRRARGRGRSRTGARATAAPACSPSSTRGTTR